MKKILDFFKKLFSTKIDKKVVETKPIQTKPVEKPSEETPIVAESTPENPNWEFIAQNIKLDTDSKKLSELRTICNKINLKIAEYGLVEKETTMPIDLIGALHFMEASLDFKTILHNGTPLGQVSKIVPVGVKFDNWHDAAVDALVSHGALKIKDWSFANMCAFAERYNGLGYRKHGVYSSYVCSYTNFSSEVGKYVSDGKWDANAAHKRPGVAAILLMLAQIRKENSSEPVKQVEETKPVEEVEQDLKWMTIAKKEIGQHEISGSKHNARIVEYHQATSLKSTTDEVPWCAAFVSWVFVQSKMISKKSARAKDWLECGTKLDKPKYGCVVVFTRDGGGHVAFYISEDSTNVTVLGGNQSDSVCISKYSKANVVGYRWPIENSI